VLSQVEVSEIYGLSVPFLSATVGWNQVTQAGLIVWSAGLLGGEFATAKGNLVLNLPPQSKSVVSWSCSR
jgi:hypothetical protein